MVEQEKAELHAYINELAFRLEKQDAQLREMERILAQLRKLFVNFFLQQIKLNCLLKFQIQVDGPRLRY